jgi:hypothetical protein
VAYFNYNKGIHMKFIKLSHFRKLTFLLLIAVGLSGCCSKEKLDTVDVKSFVAIEPTTDGNLSLNNKITGQKMKFVSCENKYETKCPSSKDGAVLVAKRNEDLTISVFKRKGNSVDCFLVFNIPGYGAITVTWHEPGNTCSRGQQS